MIAPDEEPWLDDAPDSEFSRENGDCDWTICPRCNGSGEGMFDGSTCARCGGGGEINSGM